MNGQGATDFLARWENSHAPLVELKFRAPGGVEKKFSVAVALLANEGGKWLVLQLLPLPEIPAATLTLESQTELEICRRGTRR